MTPATTLAVLAAIAAGAAAHQAWRAWGRGDRRWRIAALVIANVALAALLYPVLHPPARTAGDGTLVVLTAEAPRPLVAAGGDHVALPEAPPHPGIARVPDLATALRRHPDTTALRVLGAGLSARDRDVVAAHGLRMTFEPAPLPPGFVAIDAPTTLAAGRRFTVAGRVHAVAGARVELRDPAGHRVDRQPVDSDGRFTLTGRAGPAGRVAWTLRRLQADDTVAESVSLPATVVDGAPLRVVALAGGASPEQKYLSRWGLDAGLALQARVALGAGVDIGAATPPLTSAGLGDVDLVILDDRAFRGLGDGGRAALRDAVRDGVGLLVRLGGDPSAADRAAFAAWGFVLAPADLPRGVELPGTAQAETLAAPAPGATGNATAETEAAADAAVDAAAADHSPVALSRRALTLAAADGTPLLHAVDGSVLAAWRAEGRGRVGILNLGDTFRLQLAGRRAAYGSLWATLAGTLARAPDGNGDDMGSAIDAATLPRDARVGERVALCGLGDAATLTGPDGTSTGLAVDPATGPARCAAAWPVAAGWHTLRDGDAALPFAVRAADEAPGLARAALRDATAVLTTGRGAGVDTLARPSRAAPVPGPRWPWLLAWLMVAAGTWWFERARAGQKRS